MTWRAIFFVSRVETNATSGIVVMFDGTRTQGSEQQCTARATRAANAWGLTRVPQAWSDATGGILGASRERSARVSPESVRDAIQNAIDLLGVIGMPIQVALLMAGLMLAACALIPTWRRYLDIALYATTAVLVAGELLLIWFHWVLYANTPVANPQTGTYAGTVAVSLSGWSLRSSLSGR